MLWYKLAIPAVGIREGGSGSEKGLTIFGAVQSSPTAWTMTSRYHSQHQQNTLDVTNPKVVKWLKITSQIYGKTLKKLQKLFGDKESVK